MKPITQRERAKLFKINKTMNLLHNTNNEIYESWVDEDWDNMILKLKTQIHTLKQLLNGVQEET